MVREVLKLYTDEGKNTLNPAFYGIELTEYSYTAPRMGMPTLTATLMWGECLDKLWTQKEYVTLRGERYYLRHVPTSEKNSSDQRYKHSLTFKSERDELFANVYFYDTVYSKSTTEDKPCSNSPVFNFYGNIVEAVDRLNAALLYAGIGDSILKNGTSPDMDSKPTGDGYYAVIDTRGTGDLETSYEFDFDKKTLWEAITEFYEKTGIMFEFKGKKIVWNAYHEPISQKFEYGPKNELLSVKKTNANAKVINRITMCGSEENIPYYYPNETEYGHIKLVFGESNKILAASRVTIENYSKFLRHVRADQKIEGIYEDGKAYLKVGDAKYSDFAKLGLKTTVPVNAALVGETIGWKTEYQMTYQTKLMPPLYRSSKGGERFYNAENNKYPIPDTDEFFYFPNPYVQGSPSEHIFEDETIKPTIEGIQNADGDLFGEILEVAFDKNDNDDLKVVGEDGNALQYQHSYFYIKLNIFNGKYGFNLFDRHSQTDAMTIQVTSGNCNGCKFKIQAVEKVDAGGFNYYENPVQTTGANGNIVEGDYEQKVNKNNIQSWQQNTETNSIWICVQKDTETFGQILPSLKNNFIPKGRNGDVPGDTFNIINIDLPQEYIEAAEERLMNAGLEYMAENNEEKFTFSISASRIFFAQHPDILAQLDEYSIINVIYNGSVYELFVSSFKIDCKRNEALPDVQLELTDTIQVGESFVKQVANQAASLIPNATKGLLNLTEAERRFISKQRNDRTPYDLAIGGTAIMEGDLRSRDFIEGIAGGLGWKGDKEGHFEMDSLTLRKFLEVPELRYNHTEVNTGIQWHAPGGGIVEQSTLLMQDDEAWTGYVFLKLEDGEIGAVAVGDICMGIWHFEKGAYVNHNLPNPDPDEDINDTEDTDDGKGNFTFAGFRTIYFEILRVTDDEVVEEVVDPQTGEVSYVTKIHPNGRIMVRTRYGYPLPPMAGMNFVCYGNRTNKARQRSRYATRTYERYLSDITDYNFTTDNIRAQFGDLSNLVINNVEMYGYSAYLNSVYFDGVIKQLEQMKLFEWDASPNVIHCGANGVAKTKTLNIKVWWNKGSERIQLNDSDNHAALPYKVQYKEITDSGQTLWQDLGTDELEISHDERDTQPHYDFRIVNTDGSEALSSYSVGYVSDGAQGADGKEGKEGPQGPPGQSIQGPQGGVIRIKGAFQPGPKYYAGDEDVDGVKWIDVVWVDNANKTDRNYYVCRKTGFYDGTKGPTYSAASDGWEPFSYINALLTDLIIANQGKVKFLNSNEIVFGDDDGTIWGRIGAPNNDQNNALPIMWLGGSNAYNATTIFDKYGFARFGTSGGRRIEIDPENKEVRIYDENNNNVILLDGDENDVDKLYDCDTGNLKARDLQSQKTYTTSAEYSFGTLKIGKEGAFLAAHLDYRLVAYTAYRHTNNSGTMPMATAKGTVSVSLGIRRKGTSGFIEWSGNKELSGPDINISNSTPDAVGMSYGSNSAQGAAAFSGNFGEGEYEVAAIVNITNPTVTNWNNIIVQTAGNNTVGIYNFWSNFKAGKNSKTYIGSNSMIHATSTQDYLKAGMSGGEWIVEAVSDGNGLLFKGGKTYAKDENNVWQELDFSLIMKNKQ